MKPGKDLNEIVPRDVSELIELVREQWQGNRLPIQLFLLMCLNLAIAPAVYATTGDEITRQAAYAIGILGIVTLGLSVYLFVVIFQPERF
ncbi:MAG: K(+)-transporting ATPase subunit F [Coleofasciculus chthonoplastes F3-SA18-01]|jgi:K+-transporting ATPase KdpF subunit|uniref:K(+)-transporting ATPase subunit F n=1 Tax=Coleofasciculus chthonoplastes TaxID=64178 RepID=UPI0032F5524F